MVRIHPFVDFTFENPEDKSMFPVKANQPADAPEWVQNDLVFGEFVKRGKIIVVKGKRGGAPGGTPDGAAEDATAAATEEPKKGRK
jgi:hypothetical protein